MRRTDFSLAKLTLSLFPWWRDHFFFLAIVFLSKFKFCDTTLVSLSVSVVNCDENVNTIEIKEKQDFNWVLSVEIHNFIWIDQQTRKTYRSLCSSANHRRKENIQQWQVTCSPSSVTNAFWTSVAFLRRENTKALSAAGETILGRDRKYLYLF